MSLPPYRFCPKCGQPAVLTIKRCRRCGYQYNRLEKLRPLIIALAALLMLGGVLYAFTSAPPFVGCWVNPQMQTTLCFNRNGTGQARVEATDSHAADIAPFIWRLDHDRLKMSIQSQEGMHDADIEYSLSADNHRLMTHMPGNESAMLYYRYGYEPPPAPAAPVQSLGAGMP